MSRFVIVGAGECGTRAAFALRENGFDGEIVLVGAEPHFPYERPPLSKSAPVEPKPITSAEALKDKNLVFERGVNADAIDRNAKTVSLSGGRTLSYDRLLLATGARAHTFAGFGDAAVLRTLEDAQAIIGALAPGKRLIIIGGGFIGLELAATARSIGTKVILLEIADRLMARAVPAEIAAVVEDRHRAEGVDIRLETKITRADATSVELDNGSKLDADLVVAGVGAEPVTDLALSAGLAVENGIAVDSRFATSDTDIFAAGDCCRFPYRGRNVRLESWRAAQDQANHTARAMLGDDTPYAIVPWFWSDQYDLTLQIAGLSEPGTTKIRRPVGVSGFILFEISSNGTLVAASGVGPGNAVAKDIRLAEMIIAAHGRPDAQALADPAGNLKKFCARPVPQSKKALAKANGKDGNLMERAIFNRTGCVVSRLGFGAMGFAGWFGNQPDEEHIKALHFALERGVKFIDTARAYGDSERIVGLALKQWDDDKPFVATKVQGLGGQPQWGTVVPVEESFPKGQITRSCEDSLKTLQLDTIDCLQLHTYWPTWGTEGYWLDELRTLKKQGKVRAIGISVPDHRSDMVLPLIASGNIDSVQTIVNIFDPTAFETLVPFCQQHDVAVIARCILDEGGLTGFLTAETEFAPGDFRDGYFDVTVPRNVYISKVDALRQYVPEHASSLAALAIKFVLHHPGVTTAIISMHEQQYAAMNIAVTQEPPLGDDIFRTLMFQHRFIKNYSNFKNFGDGSAAH